MAKTESTAVNELIALQKTATPLKSDPSEDLMFRAPGRKEKVSAARMTPTIPPKGAEMPSLPRTRAPHGTQRGVPTVDAARVPAKPAVRMSTAARPVTIPTIGQWTAPEGQEVELDDEPIATKTTTRSSPAILPAPQRPSQPPPMPRNTGAMRAEGSAALPRTNGPTLPGPSLPRLPAGMRTEAPPITPVAAPFSPAPSPFAATAAMPSMQQPVANPSPFATAAMPSMQQPHGYPSAAPYLAHASPDMTSNQPWFDQQAEAPVDEIEVDFGTDRVRAGKSTDWKALLPKLIAPTIGLVILGMFVGGFLAFNGQGGKQANASKPNVVAVEAKAAGGELPVAPKADEAKAGELPVAPKAAEPAKRDEPAATKTDDPAAKTDEPKAAAKIDEPEPKPAAPITPPNIAPHTASAPARAVVAPVTGRPTFVDVRIDSTPSGATVTLIDRGKRMFLGTTPISTALDPSRQYNLELTYKDRPAHIEHIDPATTKRLAVVIGRTAKKDAKAITEAAKKPAEVAKRPQVAKREPAAAKKEPAAKPETAVAKKAPAVPKKPAVGDAVKVVDPFDAPAKPEPPKAEAQPAGEGVLMISSKPPCEIFIDGVATGLSTPQRAMKLTAGKHKVTLVNAAEKIKKTVSVTISSDQPTKVIENFMK